jgi:hypothetical protein
MLADVGRVHDQTYGRTAPGGFPLTAGTSFPHEQRDAEERA